MMLACKGRNSTDFDNQPDTLGVTKGGMTHIEDA